MNSVHTVHCECVGLAACGFSFKGLNSVCTLIAQILITFKLPNNSGRTKISFDNHHVVNKAKWKALKLFGSGTSLLQPDFMIKPAEIIMHVG